MITDYEEIRFHLRELPDRICVVRHFSKFFAIERNGRSKQFNFVRIVANNVINTTTKTGLIEREMCIVLNVLHMNMVALRRLNSI